jgi:hypothetical protein
MDGFQGIIELFCESLIFARIGDEDLGHDLTCPAVWNQEIGSPHLMISFPISLD